MTPDPNDVSVTLTLRVPPAARERVTTAVRSTRAVLGYGLQLLGGLAAGRLRGLAAEVTSPEMVEVLATLRNRVTQVGARATEAVANVQSMRTPDPPECVDDEPEEPRNPRGDR